MCVANLVRRYLPIFIVMLGLLFLPSSQSACAAPSKAPPPDRSAACALEGFRFTQICKTVGIQEITLVKGAIRVKHKNSGMVAVYREPYKEAVFYNTASKKIVSLPLAKYVSPYAYSWNFFFTRNIADIPIVESGAAKYADRAARRYRSSDKFGESQEALYAKHDIPARCVKTLLYTVTDAFKTGSEQNRLLQKMYGLPLVEGLPLELVFYDLHNMKKSYLTTSDIKAIKVSPADFDVPQGLATARNVEEVCSDVNSGGLDLFAPGIQK